MLFEFKDFPPWISQLGTNCPLKDIIKTENQCKAAASKKGLEYVGKGTHADRPAGCYSYGLTGDFSKVAFNTITDPDSTSNLGEFAGLCKSGTIRKWNII